MKWAFVQGCIFGTWLALGTTAIAAVPAQGKAFSGLDKLLNMEGIDGSYAITYRDAEGKAITRAAFITAVFDHHGTFSLDHDPAKHTADLRLNRAGSQAARLAKAAASSAHARAAMLKPGQAWPAFRLTNLQGRMVDAASLRGHTTLINFYFSQCAPCIQETPVLTAYAHAHTKVSVLAITFDDAKTTRDYVAKHHLDWPVLPDAMPLIESVGVSAYPAMAVVGPDGRVLRMALSSDIDPGHALTVAALSSWVAGARASASGKHPAGR
ncbi:MAG: TlpA family protein disulfide reductase [Xanthomonadaceae bacterium]|nr:TlpA family protein disulfide reductase [Xanthomonadaceae bacterium]MDE1963948.1 TlpA family protein disulfide reductase [Xanthomonadaceae bacterium]